ncbi:MAG TPA: magnesium transporter [Planctomycetota bacterium]|nr:magnesium transporter [Planctomycetota bacterium]
MSTPESKLVDDLRRILGAAGDVQSRLTRRLKKVHPIDVAISLQYLDEPEKTRVLATLDDRSAAVVLDETDADTKRAFLEQVDKERLARLLELMPPDEGTDLLELAPDAMEEAVLDRVEDGTAQDLRELSRYEPDTAGGQMTTDFVALREDMTASDAVRAIQGAVDAEQINWIYVTRTDGTLSGYVSIRQIVSAPPQRPVSEFMHRNVRHVTTDVDQEEVAQLADRYNLPAVPVTDPTGVLKGVITLDDVMDVMSEEASEDIYLMSGTQSIHPMTEAIRHRALKRMPWLLVTVGMGLVVMFIYSRYATWIEQTPGALWLVFFAPLVQALGGNVGIQSSTLVVRGIATGEIDYAGLPRVILSEMAVGLAIGVVFAVIVGAAAAFTRSQRLGLVVSSAIISGVLMSSFTGTVIPLLCNKFGVDPAITAGPFITALNDLICLTLYFTIATLVFAWLV